MNKKDLASLTPWIFVVAMVAPTAVGEDGSDPIGDVLDGCIGLATIGHHVNIEWPIRGADNGRANDVDWHDYGHFFLLTGPDPAGLFQYAMAGMTAKGDCDMNLTGRDPCPRGFPAEEWQRTLGMPPPCFVPTVPPGDRIPI